MNEKDLDEKAWFGEGIFSHKNLYISLGMRYTNVQNVENKITYRFAGAYIFPTNTKLHISYGTGFRAPSLYQLFDITSGNPALKSEHSEGFDIGLTQWFLGKKLSFDITYFFNDIDDLIDWVWTGPGWFDGHYFNVKEAYTQGVELNFNLTPFSWWHLQLNYTWLNAKDLEKDSWLLKRPHHRFGFNATFSLFKRYFLGIYGNYIGHYLDYENKKVKSYFVVHAGLKCKINPHISFYIRVKNLFDRDYEETYGYNALPLSAYGGAEISW